MVAGDLLTLGLYLVQQLGVLLGVGAAIVTLAAHLVAKKDDIITPKEARFARLIEQVRLGGLALMVVSGVAITVLHSVAGETYILFSPAYLFKWILIGVVALPLVKGSFEPFLPQVREGFFGATWGALLILHIIAPITSWTILLGLYVLWVATFLLVWEGLVYWLRPQRPDEKKASVIKKPIFTSAPVPTQPKLLPKPALSLKPYVTSVLAALPKPPPMPLKPAVAVVPSKPAPVPAPAPPKPALAVPAKPPEKPPQKPEEKVVDPDQYPGLPAIRVMPRTIEDIEKQDRASVVQFS
ncbi:MAG: hypothetical protein Q8P58_00945 [Candidatus Adlerbacteria bacterium]|nr:hypothetical protein [Candidatus Adlerbacteria bacterium]